MLPDFETVEEEWDAALDWDDRYQMLIALGRKLAPMDAALKTPVTKVRGCSSNVWVYPLLRDDGHFHFQADSDAAITKGIVALIVTMAEGKTPADVLKLDFEGVINRMGLRQHLSSNRTQGVPNMIARVREAASRIGQD